MSLEHCSGVFSDQVYCGLPRIWQEMGHRLLQKHYALCNNVLVCFQLSRSLVLLIFNVFGCFDEILNTPLHWCI